MTKYSFLNSDCENLALSVVDDDSIQPVEGIAPTVDRLIGDTARATNTAQGLHPIQTQWPPTYLGFIPDPHTQPLSVAGLEHTHQGTVSPISSSGRLKKHAGNNHLLAIWSATKQRIGNYDYIVLPPTAPGADSNWVDPYHTQYPSNKIMVRKSYERAFSIFLKESAKSYRGASHFALEGTSGIGKTFCCRYIIWRLFHPDGVEILTVPDTILFWSGPRDMTGWLYHKGSFYSIISIGTFLSTVLARNMFDREDAWIICDGAPPTGYMQCPTVVSLSPASFQMNDITDAKKYFKTSDCQVYLPPWTAEEIWDAAHNVYGLALSDEGQLLERFRMFGGIARSIFHSFETPNRRLEDLFNITDVTIAITEVSCTYLSYQKASGMILHLVPDNTLTQFTYQWGSTAIMKTAFETMFRMSKSKIQTFVHAGICLHLRTFYGLLFEPYFHARVTRQGCSGRIRRLSPSSNDPTMIPARIKRIWLGAKKLVTEVNNHKIPVQELHHFHTHGQIKVNCYNVPDRKNFAAVDAVAPALGEMYQVTSAENHPIKGIHLRPLRKCFESYLATGQRVKLIFVVPPDRFETYKEQQYIFPTRKTNKTGMGKEEGDENGKEKDEKESKKKEVDYDFATWDEDEAEEDENEETLAKANILREINSWIDQYVMEGNVDPLLKIVDKKVEYEVKKSFLSKWNPFPQRQD